MQRSMKDAGEGIDDDWCRNTCSQSENCPASMCECSDDNGVLRYDPNDPEIPIKDQGQVRNRFRAAMPAAKIDAPITAAEEAAANAADAIAVTAAAVAANEAARADAADDGQSALAPQGDPMGCVAVKDAG